jgi:hypothetical protein
MPADLRAGRHRPFSGKVTREGFKLRPFGGPGVTLLVRGAVRGNEADTASVVIVDVRLDAWMLILAAMYAVMAGVAVGMETVPWAGAIVAAFAAPAAIAVAVSMAGPKVEPTARMIIEALEPNPQLIESEGSEELKTLPADLDDALVRLDSWMDKRLD